MRIRDWSSDVCSSDLALSASTMAKSRYPEPEGPRRRPAMGRADRSVTTWSGNRRWVLALVALPAGLIGLSDASVDFIAAPGLWPALWTLLEIGRASCRERVCQSC